MNTKRLVIQKLLKVLILMTFSSCLVGFKLPDNNLASIEKQVYVVTDESDYFRLITISTNRENNIPILWVSNEIPTDKLDIFQKYYKGTSIYLSSQQIDELIFDQYSNPSKVVLCDKSRESMLFASLISSALQAPLFVENIPLEVQNNKNLSSIIAVGKVHIATSIKTEKLDSLDKAQNYYNQIVDNADTAVVISDPEVYSIGAEAAAYHRAKVFFNIEDGKNSKRENLIWVTSPEKLGQPNFRRLYASESENNVNDLYSQNIGIITGFTVEDMSFLLARTFAYHDMQGDWKKNYVVASFSSNSPSIISIENGNKIQTINASDLNAGNFEKLISSANYVFAYAHGSVSGLQFNDGGWPNKDSNFSVPPLLFVAEACSTMDFNEKEMDQSIVLEIISSGAVAFVGSMEIGGVSVMGNLPYSNSTRQIPIGELVRMQNSMLIDLVTDLPRAILIGDPTLFQVADQHPDITQISSSNSDGVAFEIMNIAPNSEIFLKAHSEKVIVRGVASLENGDKIHFFRGANYFAPSMGVLSDDSGQTILLIWPGGDGKISFYDNWTLSSSILKYLGESLLGVKALLLDLATISTNPWIFPSLMFVLLLFSRKRLMFNKNRLFLLVGAALLFSLILSLILFEVSLSIRVPITLALFMWSLLSLCFFKKMENIVKNAMFSVFFFLIPFLYGLFIALGIGVAGKTSMIVFKGVLLLGFSFLVFHFLLQKIGKTRNIT